MERTLADRTIDDAYLTNEIVNIHRASRCTYGSPRVWGQLRRAGIRVSEKRVARLMAECGLVGGAQPQEVAPRRQHCAGG